MGSDFIHLNSNLTNSFILVGCAFIKFETKEQALAAIEALNGKHKMEVCVGLAVYVYMYKITPNPHPSKKGVKQIL